MYIVFNDVRCFISSSSIILRVLKDAKNKGIKFRVVVIDSQPKMEGEWYLKYNDNEWHWKRSEWDLKYNDNEWHWKRSEWDLKYNDNEWHWKRNSLTHDSNRADGSVVCNFHVMFLSRSRRKS